MMPKAAANLLQPSGPMELAQRWRADAETLRRRGAESLAVSLESCADDLCEWAREWSLEALTLEQATTESGYAYSTLQHLVANGKIANAGTEHRPRIHRADLPRKPTATPTTGPQLADRVLAASRKAS